MKEKFAVLVAILMFCSCAVSAIGSDLITNGGMEGAACGSWEPASGWSQNARNHQLSGTVTDNVHGGTYAYSLTKLYYGSTIPVMYQVFSTSTSFRVTGWCRTTQNAWATIRIRENKMGTPGSSRYYDATTGSWKTNTVTWHEASSYTDGDTYGINSDFSMMEIARTEWTRFSFSVPALAGVSQYVVELSVGGDNGLGSPVAYYDDITVSDDILDNGGMEEGAPCGMWATPAGWYQNDYNHYNAGTTSNTVHGGQYAYVTHLEYPGSTVPVIYQPFATFASSFRLTGWVWADNEATAAVRIRENKLGDAGQVRYFDGSQWTYNTVPWYQAPSFVSGDTFGMRSNVTYSTASNPSWQKFDIVVPALPGGSQYCLDLASTTYMTGSCSRNVIWDDIAIKEVPFVGPIADTINAVSSATDGTCVNLDGAVASSIYYGDTATTYPGVAFAVQNPDRSAGVRVAWQWEEAESAQKVIPGNVVSIGGYVRIANGERYIQANSVAVKGTNSATPSPLFLTNKAGTSMFDVYDNVDSGTLCTGLNNMGLFVKLVGKVSYVSTDNPLTFGEYFYINDGSNLNDGSGNIGIRCRPTGDSYGPLYMPEADKYVAVTGVLGSTTVNNKSVRYFWTYNWEYVDAPAQ